jgi:hypothetical protein
MPHAVASKYDMDPMTMSIDTQIPVPRPATSRGWLLPRFPAQWVMGNLGAERTFGRLLWLQIPLQYYVVTHVQHGLSGDDLIPAVALSLMSVVAIFVLSCVAAYVALVVKKDGDRDQTLTGRVRMWVVALMIGTAGSYLLLVLSFFVARLAIELHHPIYGDLVTDRLNWLLDYFQFSEDTSKLAVPALSNLAYSAMALLVLALMRRALSPGSAKPTAQEPGAISVCLIVTVVMTTVNSIVTWD